MSDDEFDPRKDEKGRWIGAGRPSKSELDYIRQFGHLKTDEEMAEILNKPVKLIQKLRKKLVVGKTEEEQEEFELISALHTRKYWAKIKEELSGAEEQHVFESHWVNLLRQFSKDVLYSEEIQIIELIRFELISNKVIRENKESEKLIADLEQDILLERQKDRPDKQLISALADRLDNLRKSKGIFLKQLLELSDKKQKLYQELKATRDQRIKQFTDDGYTFPKLVKLLHDEQAKDRQGRMLGLMKKAMDNEYAKLTAPHKYEDNKIDIPILTPESVLMQDENKPIDNVGEEIDNTSGQ